MNHRHILSLTPTELRLWELLSRMARTYDACRPGLRWLAEKLCVDIRTISRGMKKLVSIGLIARRRQGPKSATTVVLKKAASKVKSHFRRNVQSTSSLSLPTIYQNESDLRNHAPHGTGVSKRCDWCGHIEREALFDPKKLARVYRRAVHAGHAKGSEFGWFQFVALAMHAVNTYIGDRKARNPGGLFRTLVERGQWNYITQDDEDAAGMILRGL